MKDNNEYIYIIMKDNNERIFYKKKQPYSKNIRIRLCVVRHKEFESLTFGSVASLKT